MYLPVWGLLTHCRSWWSLPNSLVLKLQPFSSCEWRSDGVTIWNLYLKCSFAFLKSRLFIQIYTEQHEGVSQLTWNRSRTLEVGSSEYVHPRRFSFVMPLEGERTSGFTSILIVSFRVKAFLNGNLMIPSSDTTILHLCSSCLPRSWTLNPLDRFCRRVSSLRIKLRMLALFEKAFLWPWSERYSLVSSSNVIVVYDL